MANTDREDRVTSTPPVLEAQVRTTLGKQVKRLRAQGLVPAVVYARGVPSTPLQLEGHALRELLAHHGLTSLLHLRVNGAEYPVVVQDVVRHPIARTLLHIDFHRIELDRPIKFTVPVLLGGEAPATNAGGVLIHGRESVEIECLPRDLPAHLELDVTPLAEINDALHVRDLQSPPGVAMLSDPDEMLAKVVATKAELELEAEEAAAREAEEEKAEAEAPSADAELRGGEATPGAPPSPPPLRRSA